MTLLEQLKPIIDNNAFPCKNGVVISDIKEDEATAYIDIVDDSLNAYGTVHGGAYFTLADTCAAFAARSDGRKHVTQSATSNFVRTTNCGRINAVSKVISRGRKVTLIESKVYDEAGKLLFVGTFTYFCIE